MLFGGQGHVTSARVKWAMDPTSSTLQHMGIDHGGTHVLVPQEFLHRTDIVTVLQKMRRQTVATLIVTLLIIRRWPRSGTCTIPSADKRERLSDGYDTKLPTVLWSSSPMAYSLPYPRGCLTLSRAPR